MNFVDARRTAVALIGAVQRKDTDRFVELWNAHPADDRAHVVQALAAIPLGILSMLNDGDGVDPDEWLDRVMYGLASEDEDEGDHDV